MSAVQNFLQQKPTIMECEEPVSATQLLVVTVATSVFMTFLMNLACEGSGSLKEFGVGVAFTFIISVPCMILMVAMKALMCAIQDQPVDYRW